MEPRRFDELAERLARALPRRGALQALAGAAGGAVLSRFGDGEAEAKDAAKKGKGGRCAKEGKPCGKVGKKGKKVSCCGSAKCQNGVCSCGANRKACGDRCISVNACCRDKDCGAGGTCRSNGKCACPANKTRCGAACVDTSKDAKNCGACGNECGGACTDGVCDCPAGQTRCGGVCIDTSSDPANCGECGVTCDNGCTNGVCDCPAGQTRCGASCVDTSNDANHCGACGVECSGTCDNGTCSVTVTATSLHGWVFYNDQNQPTPHPIDPKFVAGPGTPERGTGSAELHIATAQDGQLLSSNMLNGVPLSNFRRIRFAEYTTTGITFSVQLGIDYDGENSGRLVYVPYKDNPPQQNTWQTFDVLEDDGARWYYSVGVGKDQCGQASMCTWEQALQHYPDIRIHPTGQEGSGAGLGFVGLKLGSGNTNRTVNLDYFELEVEDHGHTIYDFEP